MRRFPIVNVVPSGTDPGYFEIAGDLTPVFHGKEWIDLSETRYPFWQYTPSTAPYGTELLVATIFTVVENEKYQGTYTVWTKSTVGALASSEFTSGNTIIRVNQPVLSGAGLELTTGFITNVSTYHFVLDGTASLLVLEGRKDSSTGTDLVGRGGSGFGETFQQALLNVQQCFSGVFAPLSPIKGQLWYDGKRLREYNGSAWTVPNEYMHTQISAASTWTITHGLDQRLVSVTVFRDTGNASPDDVKLVTPTDVTFTNANTVTLTFGSAESGTAIIRA